MGVDYCGEPDVLVALLAERDATIARLRREVDGLRADEAIHERELVRSEELAAQGAARLRERLTQAEAEVMTWRRAAAYWWAEWHRVQGRAVPEPTDAAVRAALESEDA